MALNIESLLKMYMVKERKIRKSCMVNFVLISWEVSVCCKVVHPVAKYTFKGCCRNQEFVFLSAIIILYIRLNVVASYVHGIKLRIMFIKLRIIPFSQDAHRFYLYLLFLELVLLQLMSMSS